MIIDKNETHSVLTIPLTLTIILRIFQPHAGKIF